MSRPWKLSCTCRAVQFEVDAELENLLECNCWVCQRAAFIHWRVPGKAITNLTEGRALASWVWRDLWGSNLFCPTCGTGILRTGYSEGRVSVNARCLVGVDIFELKIDRRYDGRHDMPGGPDSFKGGTPYG